MKNALLVLVGFLVFGCKSIPIDPSVYAIEANDATVIIEGCGHQPIVGYTFCRMKEGEHTSRSFVSVHIPQSNCSEDSCVGLMFFFPDGQPSHFVQVPKEQRRVDVEWSVLTGKETFDTRDRGHWIVIQTVDWEGEIKDIPEEFLMRDHVVFDKANDEPIGSRELIEIARENPTKDVAVRTLSEGEIRLRVLAEEYIPLHTATGSKWFVDQWKSKDKQWSFGYTTSGRSAVWRGR